MLVEDSTVQRLQIFSHSFENGLFKWFEIPLPSLKTLYFKGIFKKEHQILVSISVTVNEPKS